MKVVFLDIDGVIQPLGKQDRFKHLDEIEEIANIIGKTNRDEIQNQMRLKFARKLQKRNVTEKSHTSYSQKWLSNVN